MQSQYNEGAKRRHEEQRKFCVTCLQTSWTPADSECRPHGTTADTGNTAASSDTTYTHKHTNTRAGDEGLTDSFSSLSLRPVALTLRGLHSNSNTAADWSDVGNPSRESPARTVTPASWPTELWLWDLSSERPLSVWKTALGLTLGRQLCGAETAEVFTPHVRLIM